MAMARGFETLLLKSDAKQKFLEAKAIIEEKLGVHITHSDAMIIIVKEILSDSIPNNSSKQPKLNKEPIQKQRGERGNNYAARILVSSIFGKNFIDTPLVTDEESFIEHIRKVINSLSETESIVIKKRFGFDSETTHTLDAIGKDLNLSRERIRQIQVKALRKLRHPSRSDWVFSYFVIP